jgi:phage-related protein (TIGR01555 family)
MSRVVQVRSLTTISRYELSWHTVNDDPRSTRYGKPETWIYSPTNGGQSMVIHATRLLRFEGANMSRRRRIEEQGWSASVLQRVYEILRDAGMNWKSVSYILNDASQPVFKMKNLISGIASGRKEDIQNRMEVVNMARSAARMLLIDVDGEDFIYRNGSLSGLDVLLDKTWVRVAAAARMPVTRLMGMSPAGMNATGESDVRGWYDAVQSYRTTDLQPPLETIVRLLAAELKAGSPDEWTIEWPSLWQMTPTEEAAHRKSIADTDAVYIDKGVVTPEEVAATRFGGGTYSDGAVVIDVSLREPAPAQDPPQASAPGVTPPPVAQ